MSDNTGRFASRMNRPTPKMEDVELGAGRPTAKPAAATAGMGTATGSAAFQPFTSHQPAGKVNIPEPSPFNPPIAPESTEPFVKEDQPGGGNGGNLGGDIPNEPEPEPEDEDPHEPEQTKEEILSVDRMPKFVNLLLDLLLAFLMLVPFLLLYLCKNFPWYNIIEVKGPAEALNPFMEFFRASFFSAVAYAMYCMLDFVMGALPTHILRFFNWLGLFKGKRIKRQLGYMRNIHSYLTACIFFLVLVWLGGVFVYDSDPVRPAVAVGPFGGAAPAAGAAAATTVTVTPITDFRFYIERFLLLASILAAAIAFEKYLLEAIRAKFHRMAMAVRIQDVNYRQSVIRSLDAKLSSGQPHISASRAAPGEDIYLQFDPQLGLTSLARARSVASKIFNGLKTATRPHLIKDDLSKFFPAQDLDAAFAVLDANGNGEVDEKEITEACEELFDDLQNIRASLVGNARIVGKLDRLLFFIAVMIGLAVSMPFFDVGVGKAWATFGVISTAFGFMFQNAGKICFESLIFVFVEHAFDVGDRVTVDGENLIVQNIEIFTTRFVRWDGVVVYVPNSALSGKNIYNVRRSGMQSDQIIANISAQTQTQQLHQVLIQLKEKTKGEKKDFTGFVDIVEFNVLDADKMEVKFTVQYRSNFQNQAARNARKTMFNCILKDVLADLGIEYFPSG